MKLSVLRFILCAAVAFTFTVAALAQANPLPNKTGKIKAVAITGEVVKQSADGTRVTLTNGSKDTELKETDTIITGKNSSVILVFANASTVKLGSATQLAIEEFKVDDPDAVVDMASYKNRATDTEPGVSKTSLKLAYGEMVGDVKHLNRDRGSSYDIKTPVGAAGIRGTIYRIVYTPDPSGKAFFQVVTTEGLVVMQGLTQGEVKIDAGKQVEVTVDVPSTPPSTEAPATSAPLEVKGATEENKAAIESATTTITNAIQNTTFTPTSSGTTDTPKQEEKKEEPKTEEPKKEETTTPTPTPPVTPTPPPTAVTPPVTLTPAAGG